MCLLGISELTDTKGQIWLNPHYLWYLLGNLRTAEPRERGMGVWHRPSGHAVATKLNTAPGILWVQWSQAKPITPSLQQEAEGGAQLQGKTVRNGGAVVVGRVTEKPCYLESSWMLGKVVDTSKLLMARPAISLITKRLLATILQSQQTLTGNLDHLWKSLPSTHTQITCLEQGLPWLFSWAQLFLSIVDVQMWTNLWLSTSALQRQQRNSAHCPYGGLHQDSSD